MRCWLRGLVCVAVSAAGANAPAQDLQWRPAPAPSAGTPAAVVGLDRPIAVSATSASNSTAPLLGRPMPLTGTSTNVFDPTVTRTAFNSSLLSSPQVIVRGQIEELHQPMPLGPGSTDTPATPANPSTSTTIVPPSSAVTVLDAGGATLPENCGTCGDCCVPGCGLCHGCCSDGSAFWVSGEYLLWWTNGIRTPPLLTTSPPGTPTTTAGVIGAPGTSVLIGGTLDQGSFSGGRISGGWWFDEEHIWGIDGTFFALDQRTNTFSDSSFGTPILVRPFFNVAPGTNAEFGELVAFPGILAGTATVTTKSELWGADADLRRQILCWNDLHVDLLAGFRYLRLDESLGITENLLVTSPGALTGSTIVVRDSFGTKNEFYGGQIGAEAEWHWGNWYVDAIGKVGLGENHQTVDINGSTTFTLPTGLVTTQPGGLLALPTNIGHYTHNSFAVLPEAGIKLGYQFTPHIRAFVGYNFMMLTDAVRPGDQIDRVINTTQLPTSAGPGTLVGAARPAFALHESDFWAQGVDFGIEFRY